MDRYKRSILKKNKIYRPYTLDGIGNFIFFAVHGLLQRQCVECEVIWRSRRRPQCRRFLRAYLSRWTIPKFYKIIGG